MKSTFAGASLIALLSALEFQRREDGPVLFVTHYDSEEACSRFNTESVTYSFDQDNCACFVTNGGNSDCTADQLVVGVCID